MGIEDDKAAALAIDPTMTVVKLEADDRYGIRVAWMKSSMIAVLNTEEAAWKRAREIAEARGARCIRKSEPLTGKVELKREFNAVPDRLD